MIYIYKKINKRNQVVLHCEYEEMIDTHKKKAQLYKRKTEPSNFDVLEVQKY